MNFFVKFPPVNTVGSMSLVFLLLLVVLPPVISDAEESSQTVHSKPDTDPCFTSIFNGKDLTGWEGTAVTTDASIESHNH
jgi:hypothetical protein